MPQITDYLNETVDILKILHVVKPSIAIKVYRQLKIKQTKKVRTVKAHSGWWPDKGGGREETSQSCE